MLAVTIEDSPSKVGDKQRYYHNTGYTPCQVLPDYICGEISYTGLTFSKTKVFLGILTSVTHVCLTWHWIGVFTRGSHPLLSTVIESDCRGRGEISDLTPPPQPLNHQHRIRNPNEDVLSDLIMLDLKEEVINQN